MKSSIYVCMYPGLRSSNHVATIATQNAYVAILWDWGCLAILSLPQKIALVFFVRVNGTLKFIFILDYIADCNCFQQKCQQKNPTIKLNFCQKFVCIWLCFDRLDLMFWLWIRLSSKFVLEFLFRSYVWLYVFALIFRSTRLYIWTLCSTLCFVFVFDFVSIESTLWTMVFLLHCFRPASVKT